MLDRAPDALAHGPGHAPFRQGVGHFDSTLVDIAPRDRLARIDSELRRLERAHIELLVDAVGPLASTCRALHVGRSWEVVTELEERFGCAVAQRRSVGSTLDDGPFDVVVDEEIRTTSDVFAHCAELVRLVQPRGRCVFTAFSISDGADRDGPDLKLMREQFGIVAHPRATYFAALTSNGFVPDVVADLSSQAIPYWQLRQRSARHTTVDRAVLSGYLNQTICLLLVAAERFSNQPSPRGPRRPTANSVARRNNLKLPGTGSVTFGLRYH